MRLLPIIVRREFLEGIRQRWLLVTLGVTLTIITLGVLWLLRITDDILAHPHKAADIAFWTDVAGMKMDDPAAQLASTSVIALQLLVFNQLMSMTAVMAGHAGIHDRQTGTLPFLLLSPVRRVELLLGKVLGALSVPLLIYVAVGALASVIASLSPSAQGAAAAYLPPSSAWFAAFFVAAPAWSIATGTVCVLVSAVARDVRTAQQAAWALVFFATFVGSPLVVFTIPYGALIQLVLAGLVLAAAAVGLVVGSWVIGRDLTR